MLGLTTGNASIGNLSLLEAFMDKSDNRDAHKHLHQRLHSYLGVKYRALDSKADILKDFIGKVSQGDKLID